MNEIRISEIDKEMARLRGLLQNERARTPENGLYDTAVEGRVAREREKALEAGLDLLTAKRQNLEMGFPEDFGIKAPIDIERIIEQRFAALKSWLKSEFDDLTKDLGEVTGEWLKKRVEAAERELFATIDKRLPDGAGIEYRGVWHSEDIYEKGHVVTSDGSAWVARERTERGDRPGSSKKWQLMVKRGRDA